MTERGVNNAGALKSQTPRWPRTDTPILPIRGKMCRAVACLLVGSRFTAAWTVGTVGGRRPVRTPASPLDGNVKIGAPYTHPHDGDTQRQ